jgi:hypothetical protein
MTMPGGGLPSQGFTPADRDLVLVVRDAWDVLRLNQLHEVVELTIDALRTLAPGEVLGRDLTSTDAGARPSPVAMALATCSEELRVESGVPDSTGRHQVQEQQRQHQLKLHPGEWVSTYEEALARYRWLASRLVEAACKGERPLANRSAP